MKRDKSLLAEVQEIIDSAAENRTEALERFALLARDRAVLATDQHHADTGLRVAHLVEKELNLLRSKLR